MRRIEKHEARALMRLQQNDDFKVLIGLLGDDRKEAGADVEVATEVTLYRLQGRLQLYREIEQLLTEKAPNGAM